MAGQELTLGVETHCNVLRSGLLWPNSQILDYPAKPVTDKPSNFFATASVTKSKVLQH